MASSDYPRHAGRPEQLPAGRAGRFRTAQGDQDARGGTPAALLPLRAWVMATESLTWFWQRGLAARMVALCQAAQAMAGVHPTVVGALATSLEARAHAKLGQRRDALGAIHRAEAIFNRLARPRRSRTGSVLANDVCDITWKTPSPGWATPRQRWKFKNPRSKSRKAALLSWPCSGWTGPPASSPATSSTKAAALPGMRSSQSLLAREAASCYPAPGKSSKGPDHARATCPQHVNSARSSTQRRTALESADRRPATSRAAGAADPVCNVRPCSRFVRTCWCQPRLAVVDLAHSTGRTAVRRSQ
jgi:hypothetical protein